MVSGGIRGSNPTLAPYISVLEIAPWYDLGYLGKHRFDFHQFNRIVRQLWLDHPADQVVLLLGHGRHGSPFAQQQFLGVQGIHEW